MARAEQKSLPPSKAQAVAATTATVFASPTVGIIPSAAGNLVATFERDSVAVTIPVLAGVHYPMSLKSIDATNAIALHALFVG